MPKITNKLFFHPERLRRGISDWRTPPITLDLDLTNKCNNRCPKCTFPKQKKLPARFLPKDLAKNIISQAAHFGIKAFTYTGDGEPTLHEGLGELLEHGTRVGLQNGLISNGLDFTRARAERSLPHLVWARFSLDAGSPEIYRITHGLDARAFQRTLSNIEQAVSARENQGLSTKIGVSYLIFRPDPKDFEKAINLAGNLGVDYIQFKPMRFQDKHAIGGSRFDIMNLGAARMALENVKNISINKEQIIISRFTSLIKRTYHKCYGQQWTTSLGSDGKLYICCEYKYNPRYLLGNLRENMLSEIWRSEQRKFMLDNLNVPSSCFLGCKLHEINNNLSLIAHDPHKIERLSSEVEIEAPIDVNFI